MKQFGMMSLTDIPDESVLPSTDNILKIQMMNEGHYS